MYDHSVTELFFVLVVWKLVYMHTNMSVTY